MPKGKKKVEAPKSTAQQLASLIKSCRDIMRKDKGLNGDLDRLPMLTWIMFLKFLDDMEQRRDWTQTYLAVHTGLGRAFISDLENGKKEPCLRSLEILATGFEISLSQLFARL